MSAGIRSGVNWSLVKEPPVTDESFEPAMDQQQESASQPVEPAPVESIEPVQEEVIEEVVVQAPEPVIEVPTPTPTPIPVARVFDDDDLDDWDAQWALFDKNRWTVWSFLSTEPEDRVSIRLDLMQPYGVAQVRWLESFEGIDGRLEIDISLDGLTWVPLNMWSARQDFETEWWEIDVYSTARYVRFTLVNETAELELGGLAEIEILPI
jgi:hypothetical protein